MLTSTRRGISYPNPTRTDPADVPAHIKNLLDALDLDVVYGQGAIGARPAFGMGGRFYYVDSGPTMGDLWYDYVTGWALVGSLVDGSVTAAKIAASLKPSGTAADSDEALRSLGTGAGQAMPGNAATLPSGVMVPYGGAAAPTGWLLCDGTSYLRTTYANLFTAIGVAYGSADGTHFNVPDSRGRALYGKGSHTLVDTLGKNEGVAEANRAGSRHRHTPHAHVSTSGYSSLWWFGGGGTITATGAASSFSNDGMAAKDGGSGVVTDPQDGGAFLVVNHIIKT